MAQYDKDPDDDDAEFQFRGITALAKMSRTDSLRDVWVGTAGIILSIATIAYVCLHTATLGAAWTIGIGVVAALFALSWYWSMGARYRRRDLLFHGNLVELAAAQRKIKDLRAALEDSDTAIDLHDYDEDEDD